MHIVNGWMENCGTMNGLKWSTKQQDGTDGKPSSFQEPNRRMSLCVIFLCYYLYWVWMSSTDDVDVLIKSGFFSTGIMFTEWDYMKCFYGIK